MKVKVKGVVMEDDGTETSVDIFLDWEQVRLRRDTNERHFYGAGDAWTAVAPAAPTGGVERR